MSEAGSSGSRDTSPAACGKEAASKNIMVWLERLDRLTHAEIASLATVLDANDEVDTIRKLIRLCPLLADPARVMHNWLERPADELVTEIFRLRMVAEGLTACERGEQPRAITLAGWCRRVLMEHARTSHGGGVPLAIADAPTPRNAIG